MSDSLIIQQIDDVQLQVCGTGRLLPWLGPAVRGMAARQLKDQVCLHPPAERRQRWQHCDGCPHQADCSYARNYEPELPADRRRFSGQADAARPIVLAPYYPVPEQTDGNLAIPLRLTMIGPPTHRSATLVLQALADAGQSRGFGQDRIRFQLCSEGREQVQQLEANHLPARPDALPGRIPRLGVGLTAPLFLYRAPDDRAKQGQRGRSRAETKPAIHRPEFSDLFRAALRTIGGLFACYAQPLPADFSALKGAASQVRLVDHCYQPFRQAKYSSRGDQRFSLHGCTGGGVYADVPLALLPWMLWAGRLHVGTHRVAGAGGWRLVID